MNTLISGVVILISKEVWKQTDGFSNGFLGVDNDIDRKIRELGYESYIMDGVYCYPKESNLIPIL